MTPPPNVDFGHPAIFFDSHPTEQESYLYSYWSSLKTSLHIAWTGQVPKPLERGYLRLIFWTHEGTQGIKDYPLHEYNIVRHAFDEALNQPEVRRCMVMGFSGQNPYVLDVGGKNPWVEKFEREERNRKREQRFADSEEGRIGKKVDIESVIEKSEEYDEHKRQRAEEMEAAVAKHTEGFIDSGTITKAVNSITGKLHGNQYERIPDGSDKV
jgi:hypothetical protein